MIAKNRIYLNSDRTKAFPDGHKEARVLLVVEGAEISDAELEKYEGAAELAAGGGSKSESKEEGKSPKTREQTHAELSSMTKAELIEIAKAEGVESAGLNKEELIDALLGDDK